MARTKRTITRIDPTHYPGDRACGGRVRLDLTESTCEKCGPVPREEVRVNLIVFQAGSIYYSDGI